jgi:predicted MFS family arabinose efflux permease
MAEHQRLAGATYTGFAAFGAVWGTWGAAVPRVQQRAAVSDGELGVALLFIGAGALPAMLVVGRAIDRWGLKPVAGLIAALGLAALGAVELATDLPTLCLGLIVLGAVSGSADVGINAIAGRAEALSGRHVIARAHGIFSTAVVLTSLSTGVAFSAGASLSVPFAAVTLVGLLAGGSILVIVSGAQSASAGVGAGAPRRAAAGRTAPRLPRSALLPLLLLGALGALAFASENAQQSWSAVFAHNELGASNGLAAAAPAIFAAAVAISRFALSALRTTYEGTALRIGALGAGAGAAIIGAAPDFAVEAVGLVVAAAGTAVLFPVLIGLVSRTVDESQRGRATSLVTSVSYLGFLLGPAYVGAFASAGGLRVAMLAVGLLALVLVALTAPTLRVLHSRRDSVDPLMAVDVDVQRKVD